MVLEGTTGGNNGSKGNSNNANGSNGGGNEAIEDKAVTSPTKDQLALMLVEQNIEKLFTDQFDDAYAAVRVDEHIETLRIKSSRFASWIARLYYIHTKNVLGNENTKNVKSVLEAHAVYDGEKRKLYLRVGSLTDQKHRDAIYYDLANKDWSVVKITENGWQIEKSPILFRRYSSTGDSGYTIKGIS